MSDESNVPAARREPPLRLPGDPATDSAAAYLLHGAGVAGAVYTNALSPRVSKLFSGCDFDASGSQFVGEMIRRMAPRDPAEEMLIAQLALAHARVLHLTELANKQERIQNIRTVNEYADRASNTYRRLMLALAEYRRPPRQGDRFTAIRQANFAAQQVVNNSGNPTHGNATNEQGCPGGHGPAAAAGCPIKPPPALPADAGGACIAPGIGGPGEAVGAVHRATDGGGKGTDE